jgi:hypothetical protein
VTDVAIETTGGLSRDAMTSRLDARIPPGPIQQKWERHRFDMKL